MKILSYKYDRQDDSFSISILQNGQKKKLYFPCEMYYEWLANKGYNESIEIAFDIAINKLVKVKRKIFENG